MIRIAQADITTLSVDAIVNAARMAVWEAMFFISRRERRGRRNKEMKSLDEITGMVVDAAIKIHREFGPGLLESVYEKILLAELEERGLKVECQKSLSLAYAGRTFNEAYRVDMLVEERASLS